MPQQADAPVWLEQARADLAAARTQHATIKECHRRYWLQQACEKALKAYVISLLPDNLSTEETEALDAMLLFDHAPLSNSDGWEKDDIIKRWGVKAYKRLNGIRGYLASLVANHSAGPVIKRVDDTKPSRKSTAPSYRYPFRTQSAVIAPASWTGWVAYQGDESDIRQDLDAFLKHVGTQLGKGGRGT